MATVVVSVNAGAGGGGLATCEHFLESEKSGNRNSFVTGKKQHDCINVDVANMIIEVDMEFEKGYYWGCRDTFLALNMAPSHHSDEN